MDTHDGRAHRHWEALRGTERRSLDVDACETSDVSHYLRVHPVSIRGRRSIRGVSSWLMTSRRRSFLDETPVMRALRRGTVALLAVVTPFACWSGYRAIWQVRDLALLAPVEPLREGSVVRVAGESWGRVWVDLHLVLAQDARIDTVAARRMRSYGTPAIDPRSVRETLTVTLTREMLAPFHAGALELRAVATGRSQFLRTPPPVVRAATTSLHRP